jgi:DNA primase
VAHGADSLKAKLKAAPELYELILRESMKEYRGTSAEKVTLMDHFGPVLQQTADPRLRELYAAATAERLSVDLGWVLRALKSGAARVEPNRPSAVSIPEEAPPPPEPAAVQILVAKPPRAELYLLNLALMKEEYFQKVTSSEGLAQLSHEGIRQVFARAQQLYGQKACKFDTLITLLVAEVKPPEVLGLHLQPPLSELQAEGAEKMLGDCSRKIREAFLRSQSQRLAAALRGDDGESQREKLEQIMNIHRDRHSIQKDQ